MNRFLLIFKRAGGLREFAAPVIAAIFFLYQIIYSFQLRTFVTDIIGSNFMPRVVGIIGLVCVTGIIFSKIAGAMSIKNNNNNSNENDCVTKQQPPEKRKPFLAKDFAKKNTALTTLILIFIYILLMAPLGFILSTFFYLTVQILLISPEGKKRLVFTLAIAAVFTIATYFLFRYGFATFLPPGILG